MGGKPIEIAKTDLPEYIGAEHAGMLLGDDITVNSADYYVTVVSPGANRPVDRHVRANPLNRAYTRGNVLGDVGRLMLNNPFRGQSYQVSDYVWSGGSMVASVISTMSVAQRVFVPTSITITSPQTYLAQFSVSDRVSQMIVANALTLNDTAQQTHLSVIKSASLAIGQATAASVSSFVSALRSSPDGCVQDVLDDYVRSPLGSWQTAFGSASTGLGALDARNVASTMLGVLSQQLSAHTTTAARNVVSQAFNTYVAQYGVTPLDNYASMITGLTNLSASGLVGAGLNQARGIWTSALNQASSSLAVLVAALPASPVSQDVTTHWASVASQAHGVISALVGPSAMSRNTSDFLSAQELMAYPAFSRASARLRRGMADIGAVNGSAYVMGLAHLEDGYAAQNLEVRGRLVSDAYRAVLDYLAQTQTLVANYELAEKGQIRDYELAKLQAKSGFLTGLSQLLVQVSTQASSDWLRNYESSLAAVRAAVTDAMAMDRNQAEWALASAKEILNAEVVAIEGASAGSRAAGDLAGALTGAQAAITGSYASIHGSSADAATRLDAASTQLYSVVAESLRLGGSQVPELYGTFIQGITGYLGLFASATQMSLDVAKTYIQAQNSYEVQMVQLMEKDIKWDCDSWGALSSFLGTTSGAPHLSTQWEPGMTAGEGVSAGLGVLSAIAAVVGAIANAKTAAKK